MMKLVEETALVIDVKNDFVFLQRQKDKNCGSCKSKGACGVATLSLVSENNLKLVNHLNLKKGDTAIVGIPPANLLTGAVMMYMLPLIGLIVFAVVGKILVNEASAIIFGLSGFFVSLLAVKKLLSYKNITNLMQPRLVRKIIPVIS